jgi:hypothetical protein
MTDQIDAGKRVLTWEQSGWDWLNFRSELKVPAKSRAGAWSKTSRDVRTQGYNLPEARWSRGNANPLSNVERVLCAQQVISKLSSSAPKPTAIVDASKNGLTLREQRHNARYTTEQISAAVAALGATRGFAEGKHISRVDRKQIAKDCGVSLQMVDILRKKHKAKLDNAWSLS